MKVLMLSILQLVTLVVSIGNAIGQHYEARHGGPGDIPTGEGYSFSSRRRGNDFGKTRAADDTDFHAVRGAFLDTDEALRDQQSASGSGGRHNGVGGRRPQHSCDNNDIAECVGLLEVLTNKEIGFAATVDELNNMCPVLLDGLQCIDNYTRRCLNHKHREYFNKLYAGTIRVIKDLCNAKGKYQQEYINHAPCMRQVNPKYNRCSEVYHEKTADLNQINDAVVQLSDEEKNKNVITLCCSFQEYLQCSEQVVLETCGNETALFTKEFLDRMAGPIVQDLCRAFSFSLHSCVGESSLSTQMNVGDLEEEVEEAVLHTSTLTNSESTSKPIDPYTTLPLSPLSNSDSPSVLQNPSVETFTHGTTIKPITPHSGVPEIDYGDNYLVSEEELTNHLVPVADERGEEKKQTVVDSATPTTFKCLNYAPGSKVCNAGRFVEAPGRMTLTLIAASLLVFRWFLA